MTTETNKLHGQQNGVNGTSGHSNGYKLGNFCIDEYRPMRVVCIGAGFSGILAGIRFPQKVPNIDFAIYEKNPAIGGTWYSNRYPGLSCDIPSHSYQYAFEDNTEWSAFYAPGPEIREYLERVADKYKVKKYIHLEHEVVGAYWEEREGKWQLRVRRPSPNSTPDNKQYEEFEDKADVLYTALGSLSRLHWPEIDGLRDFKGCLMHSAEWGSANQHWEESTKEWADKKVGVIGVGSSAIQMMPMLQPRVAHLVNFVRSQTWLATAFLEDKLTDLLGRDPAGNYTFTEEDKQRFRDPAFYKKFRHAVEHELNSSYQLTLKGTEAQQQIREAFTENMKQRLAKKPWIADYIIPNFGAACRRLTPGPGYLEALCQDNVTFEPTQIKRITETGIELVDGKHHDLDVLVCATGFDTSYKYPFPFVGQGITLEEKYTPYPRTYLSVCLDEFPNCFHSFGPNSGLYGGSLLAILERQVDYAVMATLKLQRERLKSMVVKREAVDDFDEYLEAYFPKTVHSERCRSWYKLGKDEGRIVGLWPGSQLHYLRALSHPRWEDFDYQPLDSVKNRFYWLGDGQTYNEKTLTGDRAWYLNPDEVDYPPVPEN